MSRTPPIRPDLLVWALLCLLPTLAGAQLDASFQASVTSGTNPLTVQFTDTTSGGPTFWQWDFGDGHTSLEQSPQHVYQADGTFDVTLTVFAGLTATDSVIQPGLITVAPAPQTTAFSASVTQGTNPLTVQFSDASSGAITGWLWDFGDGSTSTQQHPEYVFSSGTSTTTYDVSLTTFIGEQQQTLVQPALISVDPAPIVAAFAMDPANGLNPLVVQFENQSTGPYETLRWTLGNGQQFVDEETFSSQYVSGDTPQQYQVTLEAILGTQVEVASATVTVQPNPFAFEVTPSVTVGSGDVSVQFDNQTPDSEGVFWLWDFGDGAQSNQRSPSHIYFSETLASFDVQLTATIGGQQQTLQLDDLITVAPAVFGGPVFVFHDGLTPQLLDPADLDGDGRLDHLWENKGGLFWRARLANGGLGPELLAADDPLPLQTSQTRVITSGDLDGDGDVDLVVARALNSFGEPPFGFIRWARNDGLGGFAAPLTLATEVESLRDLVTANLDGDGDLDLLGCSRGPTGTGAVAPGAWWLENTDGLGAFGSEQAILAVNSAQDLAVGDVDGDGDQDLVLRHLGLTLAINAGGLGTLWHPQDLDSPESMAIGETSGDLLLADLDDDGDLDLVAAHDRAGWLENLDGAGGFGSWQALDPPEERGCTALRVADLDLDGDHDILHDQTTFTAAGFPLQSRLHWHENLDGQASFGPARWIVDEAVTLGSVLDDDLDGDPDVLVTAPQNPIRAIENLTVNPAWSPIGPSLAGADGDPRLTATGALAPASQVTLVLRGALPGTPSILVLGSAPLLAPFKGGVLVPHPDVLVTWPVTANGDAVLTATWPAGVAPGDPVHAQWWLVDPAAPVGLSASNGVVTLTL